MLNVLITVDTEVWPMSSDWQRVGLHDDFSRDYLGLTDSGNFGIPFQIQRLNSFGLKAAFFVEALHASVVGPIWLQRMVDDIHAGRQEIQLHLHPEWLKWADADDLPGPRGANMKNFNVDEQTRLIEKGIENLTKVGATNVCAFRAGNYGANWETLDALARNGLEFDTSYNEYYLNNDCAMNGRRTLRQPEMLRGVVEFPIAQFVDRPNHVRHVQVCACSFSEMKNALMQAWKAGWKYFVIVSHSFELIRNRSQRNRPARADSVVINRFERLCAFLGANRDRFNTVGFHDLDPAMVCAPDEPPALKSRLDRTVWRYVEQAARRIL